MRGIGGGRGGVVLPVPCDGLFGEACHGIGFLAEGGKSQHADRTFRGVVHRGQVRDVHFAHQGAAGPPWRYAQRLGEVVGGSEHDAGVASRDASGYGFRVGGHAEVPFGTCGTLRDWHHATHRSTGTGLPPRSPRIATARRHPWTTLRRCAPPPASGRKTYQHRHQPTGGGTGWRGASPAWWRCPGIRQAAHACNGDGTAPRWRGIARRAGRRQW